MFTTKRSTSLRVTYSLQLKLYQKKGAFFFTLFGNQTLKVVCTKIHWQLNIKF